VNEINAKAGVYHNLKGFNDTSERQMYDQTLLHQLRDDFDGNIKNVWDSYTIDRKAFQ